MLKNILILSVFVFSVQSFAKTQNRSKINLRKLQVSSSQFKLLSRNISSSNIDKEKLSNQLNNTYEFKKSLRRGAVYGLDQEKQNRY